MNLVANAPSTLQKTSGFEEALKFIRVSHKSLAKPNCSHLLINGEAIELPKVLWGQDFEVRMSLKADGSESIRKFMKALPKQFQKSRLFWGTYIFLVNKMFCESFDITQSVIRFSQISNDQCALFHTDFVHVRLFQTIRGPGTEFLLNDNVKRAGLGSGSNEKIVRDFKKVQYAKAKDILLMRGEKWFANKAFVHRSPPIEHSRLKRLYFCLDKPL